MVVRNTVNLLRQKVICLIRRIWFLAWDIITAPFRMVWRILESVAEVLLVMAKTSAQKIIVLVLTVLTILLISIMTYTIFVHLYMPTAEISRPVNLGFRACSSGHGVCSFPSANVSFLRDDGTQKEELGAGQKYRIVLDIEMPDTPNNRNLGMFQVVIEMFDRRGVRTASSHRAVMPKYRSIVLRMVDFFILSPFYFLGYMEQKQDLHVELFTHYVDDYYHPSVGAKIEIQSHNIQFYSVSLKLFANFSGLKYFLYYWPVTSALCGIMYNITLLTILVLGAMYKKAESLRKISETLRLQSSLTSASEQDSDGKANKSKEEEDSNVSSSTLTVDGKESLEESTTSTDDLEAYDLPLVQEPDDFPTNDGDKDMEFVAELRHRRIN